MKQALHNSSWMMADKVINMFLSFLLTLLLTRYFSPEAFGVYAYAFSLASIFVVLGGLGLEGVVVRELVTHKNKPHDIVGSVFVAKLLAYGLGFVLILLFTFSTEEAGSESFNLMLLAAAALFFKAFNVFDIWNQAWLQSKKTMLASCSSAAVGVLAKCLFVLQGASLVMVAAVNIAQSALFSALLTFFYFKGGLNQILSRGFSFNTISSLLKKSYLIYLGSLCAIINLKIDQIMLNWLVGSAEVGIYAVAASLSEAWYFVATAVVASFFPQLIELKKVDETSFTNKLQHLLDALMVAALLVALLMQVIAAPMVGLLFGQAFHAASPILIIHIWAGIFIFMRAVLSKWILIEDILVFSLITQGLGAMANVLLNFWLIPEFGGVGAAYATVGSYIMSSYVALLVYSRTRGMFSMMTKSLLLPFRLPTMLWNYVSKV